MGAYLTSTYISSSVQLGAGMSLVEDKNFSGSSCTFSGLTGNYIYVAYVAGAPAGAGGMTIRINNNSLATNYWRDEIYGSDVAVTGARANDNSIGSMSAAGVHVWEVTIGGDLYTNNVTYHVRNMDDNGANTNLRLLTGIFGAVAVTSIGFFSDVAFNGRAMLYRLAPR